MDTFNTSDTSDALDTSDISDTSDTSDISDISDTLNTSDISDISDTLDTLNISDTNSVDDNKKSSCGRKKVSVFISVDMLVDTKEKLQCLVDKRVNPEFQHLLSAVRSYNKKGAECDLFEVLDEDRLINLETFMSNELGCEIKFLRPRQNDNFNKKYEVNKSGVVDVKFRRITDDDRMNNINSAYPQVFVEYDGKWIFKGLQLRMA